MSDPSQPVTASEAQIIQQAAAGAVAKLLGEQPKIEETLNDPKGPFVNTVEEATEMATQNLSSIAPQEATTNEGGPGPVVVPSTGNGGRDETTGTGVSMDRATADQSTGPSTVSRHKRVVNPFLPWERQIVTTIIGPLIRSIIEQEQGIEGAKDLHQRFVKREKCGDLVPIHAFRRWLDILDIKFTRSISIGAASPAPARGESNPQSPPAHHPKTRVNDQLLHSPGGDVTFDNE